MNFRNPAVLMGIGGIATLVLLLVVVWLLWRTGGAETVSDNAAVIGALVALGGVFTAQMVSIALDDRRTQEARDLEVQRAGEAALRNYFEDVGELLIEKPLREASPGDNLSTVVRAQTLSVLEGLDPDRKRLLLLFLYESGLIRTDKPVISLVDANLRKVALIEVTLSGADLRDADMRDADLSKAILFDSNLSGARLNRAILSGALLSGAYPSRTDLSDAILSESNLSGAILGRANLNRADLGNADLSNAELRDADLRLANLSGANLRDAILSGALLYRADFSGANLRDAILRVAHLSGADLSGADLSGANMRGANITRQELEQQAKSLEGATMPDGSKHP